MEKTKKSRLSFCSAVSLGVMTLAIGCGTPKSNVTPITNPASSGSGTGAGKGTKKSPAKNKTATQCSPEFLLKYSRINLTPEEKDLPTYDIIGDYFTALSGDPILPGDEDKSDPQRSQEFSDQLDSYTKRLAEYENQLDTHTLVSQDIDWMRQEGKCLDKGITIDPAKDPLIAEAKTISDQQLLANKPNVLLGKSLLPLAEVGIRLIEFPEMIEGQDIHIDRSFFTHSGRSTKVQNVSDLLQDVVAATDEIKMDFPNFAKRYAAVHWMSHSSHSFAQVIKTEAEPEADFFFFHKDKYKRPTGPKPLPPCGAPYFAAKTNYCTFLGIAKTSTRTEIRKAYKLEALRVHPDKNPVDQADHFSELTRILAENNKRFIDQASKCTAADDL